MPKLIIYDTVLTPREVEVPEICPKCSGYLAKELADVDDTSLIAWDLNDRGYVSAFKASQDVSGQRVPGPFLDVVEEARNSPGESFYGPIALWCACGEWNVEGTVDVREFAKVGG